MELVTILCRVLKVFLLNDYIGMCIKTHDVVADFTWENYVNNFIEMTHI